MNVPALAAYGIAALSIVYALVFLGFVRGHPDAHGAAALANACIALSGILVSVAAIELGARLGNPWIGPFGVGYGLLSAAHGAFAAISELGGTTEPGISLTDPRGFATFGLAGLWMLVVGLTAQGGPAGSPGWLGPVAIAGGIDLIALFVATVAGVELPILLTGGLASVILGPAFWIGVAQALTAAARGGYPGST